jgi:DNA-binding transcriptional LysR family regulator
VTLPWAVQGGQCGAQLREHEILRVASDGSHVHRDLEIGATPPSRPEIAAETLGTDRMAVIFRAGHPLADGELTPRRLVPVILTWHHRNDTDPAHTWLRAQVRQALRGILDTD